MFQQLLHFLLHLSPFLFLIRKSSASLYGTNTTYCPSSNCNGVTVAYPFWRSDINTKHYCGYVGVECPSSPSSKGAGDPIFRLNDSSNYQIKNINYTNQSLTLVDIDVAHQICPRARHNITLGRGHFEILSYSHLDVNISFHFNCTNIFHSLSTSSYIPCLGSGTNHSYFTIGDEKEGLDNWYDYCDEKVVATVIKSHEIHDGYANWLRKVMEKGFVLDWKPPSLNCNSCEASNGRCGFDYELREFLCICSDDTVGKNYQCKDARKGDANIPLKVGIGVSAGVFGIIATIVAFFCYFRRKKNGLGSSYFSRGISSLPSSRRDVEKSGIYPGVHIFKCSELEKATNYFDSKKELGDGGFGTVYKGKLKDGRTVAVKRLYENNYKRVEQFMNEVEILARLRHKNLVSLYGCTSHHGRGLLLVYEYIPNGTVADHLHGDHAKPDPLTWTARMSIAVETATALAYLHASDVIHRDVKTNNILLDNNFCVKVADFGLSRLFPNNVTHVSTAPQGTPGYVDPEYRECYQLTSKSDVFSFGVVLIELISSKPAVDITRHRHEINLSNMALNKIQKDALDELVDPSLGYDSDSTVKMMINCVAELAFRCLQNDKEMRPTMEEALEVLKGIQSEDKRFD